MKKALSLSIVIPVYNEELHLKACLDAITNQTVKPLEVIIVDNNSTDTSVQIAHAYRFVTVIKEARQGIVFARTAGFNAASGEIIARIDADTVLPPTWVAQVMHFYSSPQHLDYALTGGGYFYNIRLPRFNGWMQSQLAYRVNRAVTGHYILWGSNMALPKKLWLEVRTKVCQRTDIHEDMDLAIHLHEAGYQIRYEAKKLRVGVDLRRVFKDRDQSRTHMRRWPQTLKVHQYHFWYMGVLGNILLWYFIQPFIFFLEAMAWLFGRR
ncbi:MAG: putative glycosyltransferase [Candidatus Saccharibacteria bacterium]|nr:putative glycosyltransferase [Candidatus Saccharibacteria bacterium]